MPATATIEEKRHHMRSLVSRSYIWFQILALVLTAGAPVLCVADDGHMTIESPELTPCRRDFDLHHGPTGDRESDLAAHGCRDVPLDVGSAVSQNGRVVPEMPTCVAATWRRRWLEPRRVLGAERCSSSRPSDALGHVASVVLLV